MPQEEAIRQTHGQLVTRKGINKMMIPILAMIALVVLVISFFQFLGEYVYDYRLSDTSVEFIIFRQIKVWNVPFEEITDIRPALRSDMLSIQKPAFMFVSHPLGKFVFIKRNKGIFRQIIVTPNNRNEFVDNVRAKIKKTAD